LLDLMMDTDVLKERIINGALSDVFKRAPLAAAPRKVAAANDPADDAASEANSLESTEPSN
jgi:hypothetical protein